MQKTRQQILDVLNHLGRATVHEISKELQQMRGDNITPVTVRHHLNLLQKENLITCPEIKHRNKPGRPQHVYELTGKAHDHLPTNYEQLAENLLFELRRHLPKSNVNVILEGVADDMSMAAGIPDTDIENKLDLVVNYLSQHGYDASWEEREFDYILHTSNCPYHHISQHDESLCQMDMRLISNLVGKVPRRTALVANGDSTCSYAFPKD
jgi:DeoR family suf operon transcriptional repressor